ncbi:MAG: extracellular solute-binding protein, partial [Chloroflexota bacterium]
MNRWIIFSLMLIAVVMTIVACAAPAPQIVEKTVVVEKPVEKIVEKTVVVKETSVPAVVTAAPAPKPAAKDTGTIVALGPFRGDDQVRFLAVIAEFNKANPKTKVIYAGTDQFNTLINVNVEAGNPPDIAPIPQPGLMQKFARDGKIVPLWPEVVKLIDQNYAPAWKDLGSYNGKVYGVFHRVNGKGYVYYNKPAFEKAG